MALFIEIVVDPGAARDPEVTAVLAEICPVNIFERDRDGALRIVEDNVDECTLCELCLGVGTPGQVRVLRLYDNRRPLERTP